MRCPFHILWKWNETMHNNENQTALIQTFILQQREKYLFSDYIIIRDDKSYWWPWDLIKNYLMTPQHQDCLRDFFMHCLFWVDTISTLLKIIHKKWAVFFSINALVDFVLIELPFVHCKNLHIYGILQNMVLILRSLH